MKFVCMKNNLERALGIAERFTGKNVTLPILGNILLEFNSNSFYVTATNLESAVRISIPGRVTGSGSVSVPAKITSALIQSIKEEKVELEEKQRHLVVRTDTKDSKINGVNVEDFPLIPKIKNSSTFLVDSVELRIGLEKVLPAVSVSDFKPELSGIYFKVSGTSLHLASTDTFRLSEKQLELEEKYGGEPIFFILPQKVSQEVARIFNNDEVIKISLGENQILFETTEISLISRLIEGNFPDYSGIVPKNYETLCYVSRQELLDSIRSSSLFSSKLQDVTFRFEEKRIEITSRNSEVGEYATSIPASCKGKDISLSFNYRYFLDGLNVLDEEECFLGLGSDVSPTLLRNKEDGSFLYVLMPIRLS